MKEQELQEMIFGTRPLIEAYNAGREIEKVLLLKGGKSPQMAEIIALARAHDTPMQYVPVEKLNRITRKNHQGVVAFISPIIYQFIEQLIPMLYEQGKEPFIIVLDRITDVRNFEALPDRLRLPVHMPFWCLHAARPITADAVKASAGALSQLAVCRVENLKTAIDF